MLARNRVSWTGMIREIHGTVLSAHNASVVVDVNGFGIEIRTDASASYAVGEHARFATYLAVKQDGLELYGFQDDADRDFFELMISVSGIGPKTALSILNRASRVSLEGAIAKHDLSYLTKVVGLGKKSAEKILLELGEKIGAHSHDEADSEVFDTLVALGYTEREARSALQNVPEQITGKEARLKAALGNKK